MSVRDTYRIAHTAACKLQLAADHPNRDLRFILGHAFTLDNLRLRIAEIEVSGTSDSDSEPEAEDSAHPRAVCTGTVPGPEGLQRRVSFQTGQAGVRSEKDRKRSPPPPQPPMLEEDTESESEEEEEEEEEEEAEEDDAEEEDLGLVRFASAAAKPPRIVDDEEGGNGEVGVGVEGREEVTDPKRFDEEALKKLCEGKGSQELRDAYFGVAGCRCHGKKGPHVENFWELPLPEGVGGPRLAVMQVA